MQPTSPEVPPPSTPTQQPDAPAPRSVWSKALSLIGVVICFEVGVFLMVFPWMEAWNQNWFPSQHIFLLDLWESNYFRGALTGLGGINVYISFAEMMRLLRV
ncbi:hypothetical protein F183_A00530 [Bryobacterales bacterium F-183]|nr:hypothetical protein F183_A00530 [Bryobacterales bacterium F-183]